MEPSSLYVHIPFCHHLCAYCDFPKVLYAKAWGFSYLEALEKELTWRKVPKRPLRTLYLGGGSPSALSLEELTALFRILSPYFDEKTEVSFEANPEDLSEEKLLFLKEAGVSRLSIGIESSLPKYLLLMGRHHSFEDAKQALERAKRLGFRRLSADLIYGLPLEAPEEAREEAKNFLSLGLTHYSAYSLSVHPGTRFYNRGIKEMEEGACADLYEALLSAFREAGFERYEVSNFAKDGDYSRHNLVYWRDEPYFAVGLGASGYVGRVRYTNTRNLSSYLKGDFEAEREVLTPQSEKEDFFLTNLRLAKGFSLSRYKERFGEDFEKRYEKEIEPLKAHGLLETKDGFARATDRGLLLLDQILLALF